MVSVPTRTRSGSNCPWHGEYCIYRPCPYLDALQRKEDKDEKSVAKNLAVFRPAKPTPPKAGSSVGQQEQAKDCNTCSDLNCSIYGCLQG